MLFNDRGGYTSAMDQGYVDSSSTNFLAGYEASLGPQDFGGPLSFDEETGAVPGEQVLTTKQIGQTLGEGRGSGTFLDSMKAAMYKGVTDVELSLSASGSEPNVGPDLYSKEKRAELRNIARANQMNIVSVHTPVQAVANMSGFAGEQRGFMDEQRELQVNEVKKAIQFAADTTEGGAVVVHTGEFQRPFIEQPWAQNEYGEFKQYYEEPEKFVKYVVDQRTGKIMGDARKNQVVYEPMYKTAGDDGLVGKQSTDPHSGRTKILDKDDWVDMQGNYIDPTDDKRLFERVPHWNQDFTEFKTKRMTWDAFKERAEKWNKDFAEDIAKNPGMHMDTEEMFMKTQYQNRALQMKGSSLYHGRFYNKEKEAMDKAKELLKAWEKIEQATPEKDRWRLFKQYREMYGRDFLTQLGLDAPTYELPSKIIKQFIQDQEHSLRYAHEASGSADAQSATFMEDAANIVSVEKYGKMKSRESYADAGIYAMDLTRDKGLEKPIFLAPENIFPEMGYGSHPEEMTELVLSARDRMAERLMKERGFSSHEAQAQAKKHINTTLDTEHLGMWKRYLQKKPGETDNQFNKRFDTWYLDQVKKMHEKGVIGHVHIADGFGYGHGNLPAGQGNTPVVSAIRYLKEKGYGGAYLSEGYGDAPRMMRDAWRAFGSPVYSHVGPMGGSRPGSHDRWSDVQFSYFGRNVPPLYVFGAYSPSQEWKLWSEVPFE